MSDLDRKLNEIAGEREVIDAALSKVNKTKSDLVSKKRTLDKAEKDARYAAEAAKRQEIFDSITAEIFEAYESVRLSGVTNMFNIGLVQDLMGVNVTRKQLLLIMDMDEDNYSKLEKKFGVGKAKQIAKKIGVANLNGFGDED